MKVYNKNTNKIEDLPLTLVTDNGIVKYTNRLTIEELNNLGYYKIKYTNTIDKKWYKAGEYTYNINADNICEITIEAIPLDLDVVKQRMLKEVKDSFLSLGRPIVDTGLGFSVNGGKEDIINIQTLKDLGIKIVRTADNTFVTVEPEDLDTILLKIKENGVTLYNKKWDKENTINSFGSIDECIAYTKEPYEVEQLVVDEDGNPILDEDGNEQYETVIKYKNNITEW